MRLREFGHVRRCNLLRAERAEMVHNTRTPAPRSVLKVTVVPDAHKITGATVRSPKLQAPLPALLEHARSQALRLVLLLLHPRLHHHGGVVNGRIICVCDLNGAMDGPSLSHQIVLLGVQVRKRLCLPRGNRAHAHGSECPRRRPTRPDS